MEILINLTQVPDFCKSIRLIIIPIQIVLNQQIITQNLKIKHKLIIPRIISLINRLVPKIKLYKILQAEKTNPYLKTKILPIHLIIISNKIKAINKFII